MSKNTRAAAESAARRLLKKMKTDGWKIRVWENCGWHYALHNGPVNLNESSPGSYFCLVGTRNDDAGGLAMWTDTEQYYEDPNECVAKALKCAHQVLKGMVNVLRPMLKAHDLRIAAV